MGRLSFSENLAMEPPHIERLHALFLRNHSLSNTRTISLSECGGVLLPENAVLGLAEGSANEEWTRTLGVCACNRECVLASELHFEHGSQEPVIIMPAAFQPPEPGQRLNARPEPFATPQHERAAAIVARAQRYITLSAQTVGGGPDKLYLRRLLVALALLLLGACCGAVLLQVLLGARRAAAAKDMSGVPQRR